MASKRKLPFFNFCPSDHTSDPAVKMLHPLAELVWLRMLFMMSECEDRGRLAVKGKPIPLTIIAHECRMPVNQVKDCIKQILEKGVASKGPDGVIFSRRMVRDEGYRKKAAKFGRKGGNPALSKKSEYLPQDKTPVAGKVLWNGLYWFPDKLEKVLESKIAEVKRLERKRAELDITNIVRTIQPLSGCKYGAVLRRGKVYIVRTYIVGSSSLSFSFYLTFHPHRSLNGQ
jgi:hypothetical protein